MLVQHTDVPNRGVVLEKERDCHAFQPVSGGLVLFLTVLLCVASSFHPGTGCRPILLSKKKLALFLRERRETTPNEGGVARPLQVLAVDNSELESCKEVHVQYFRKKSQRNKCHGRKSRVGTQHHRTECCLDLPTTGNSCECFTTYSHTRRYRIENVIYIYIYEKHVLLNRCGKLA